MADFLTKKSIGSRNIKGRFDTVRGGVFIKPSLADLKKINGKEKWGKFPVFF